MTNVADHALSFALEHALVSRAAVDGLPVESRELRGSQRLARLARAGALDAGLLARRLADECGLPAVRLRGRHPPSDVLGTLPRQLILAQGVLPFARDEAGLHVAVADPLDRETLEAIAFVADSSDLHVCVAAADDLEEALARHCGGETEGRIADAGPEDAGGAGEAPLVRRVQAVIEDALRHRASDVHFEPLEQGLRVRYRIDGSLLEAGMHPPGLQAAMISRLKIMAGISIAEKRVPQDGRIRLGAGGRRLDLRVSSLPTTHGESIVVRILEQEGRRLGLPDLGFAPDDRAALERLIAAPDGMVLVTGPTGSGKTTTLYGCLHHLNQPGRKIITVEDPIEYQLAGVNQVPVRPECGMTFSLALRAMLRQAPNVVMVGEVRDAETADIAINAALTGHLVFSTLHTNDAPGAVTRLIDMGVKPFLVAAALQATVAQRLVRRVCPHCCRPYQPTDAELESLSLGPAQAAGATFRRGAGCERCHGSGFLGRLGIFEIFLITDEIRALIYDRPSAARLRTQARAAGMRSLREDGVRKVLAGLTTIEEVNAATSGAPSRPFSP